MVGKTPKAELNIKRGAKGLRFSAMFASLGVRSRFFALQRRQQATTLVQLVGPPLERGITWSKVRSLERTPQY